MADDDLDAPLGHGTPKKRRLVLPFTAPQLIAAALGVMLVVFALWTVMVEDPLGGEPIAVTSIAPPPPGGKDAAKDVAKDAAKDAASPAEPRPDGAAGEPEMQDNNPVPGHRYDGPEAGGAPPAAQGAEAAPEGRTVTIIDGTSGKRENVVLPGESGAKTALKGDQRLLETTRHGAVPKIGADGLKPVQAYAQPVKMVAGKTDLPRIAIVIGGMGVSASSTNEALSSLPGPVTLAFAPYGTNLDSQVARARAGGHEILLQVPMEPFDYPDNDPGPQTLLTSLGTDQNLDRLQWLMSRFQGYVGLTNYMGARFTASEAALTPVLRETVKRGLLYMDDGSSPRSLAAQLSGANSVSFVKTDVVLDAVPTPGEVDRALAKLEAIARQRGIAVGVASALPGVIGRIAAWTKTAEQDGVLLVPITAAAVKEKSS